jgi:hypothetical protein
MNFIPSTQNANLMKQTERKSGRDLQTLVHAIESSLQTNPKMKIESPKRLVDKDTGRLREHDIVLTFTEGHHELLVALECRDRSRPVGVPEVEAFWAKCQRTAINQGIIVSSRGFAKSAITKADGYKVGCLTIEEIGRFDWCQAPGLLLLNHDLVRVHAQMNFPRDPPVGGRLLLADGNELNDQMLCNWAFHCFNNYVPNRNELIGNSTFSFVENNPPIFCDHNGTRMQAAQLVLNATYSVEQKLVPFEFRSYFDSARSRSVTKAAVARIEVGGKPASMVLSREDTGILKVTIVPDPTELPSDPKT